MIASANRRHWAHRPGCKPVAGFLIGAAVAWAFHAVGPTDARSGNPSEPKSEGTFSANHPRATSRSKEPLETASDSIGWDELCGLSSDEMAALGSRWLDVRPKSPALTAKIGLLFQLWSERFPEDCFQWVKARDFPARLSGHFPAIVASLVRRSPGAAVAAWMSLPGGKAKAEAASRLAEAWSTSDPESALRWALEDDGPGKVRAREALFGAWGARDPEAAANAAVSHFKSAGERSGYVSRVLSTWARQDPTRAIRWLEHSALAPADIASLRSQAIGDLLVNDPAASGPFLSKLEPGTATRNAVVRASARLADMDPAAAWAWADSLPGEVLKTLARGNILGQLAKTNPHLAIDQAARLPDRTLELALIEADAVRRAGIGPSDALLWAENLPDPIRRVAAVDATLYEMAGPRPTDALAAAFAPAAGPERQARLSVLGRAFTDGRMSSQETGWLLNAPHDQVEALAAAIREAGGDAAHDRFQKSRRSSPK